MVDPGDVIGVLFDCFDQSACDDLRAFLASNPDVGRWHIAADFCLRDKDRPNDTFAFSLIPYDADLSELREEINNHLPKDLKKTRDISDAAIAFLREGRRFHFTFIFRERRAIFNNGGERDLPLGIARESIDHTITTALAHGRSGDNLRRFRLLQQAARASTFNVGLLANVYLFAYLMCFVSLALARERDLDILGWFADRDNMITWCDGVVWDIAIDTLHGLAARLHIALPQTAPIVAAPNPVLPPDQAMWYDELARIPDYVAGMFAAWDLDQNHVPGERAKYRRMARELIADAHNTAIFRVA